MAHPKGFDSVLLLPESSRSSIVPTGFAKLNAKVSSESPPGIMGPENTTFWPTKSEAPNVEGEVNAPPANEIVISAPPPLSVKLMLPAPSVQVVGPPVADTAAIEKRALLKSGAAGSPGVSSSSPRPLQLPLSVPVPPPLENVKSGCVPSTAGSENVAIVSAFASAAPPNASVAAMRRMVRLVISLFPFWIQAVIRRLRTPNRPLADAQKRQKNAVDAKCSPAFNLRTISPGKSNSRVAFFAQSRTKKSEQTRGLLA